MKKIIIVLILLFAATVIFANPINLGNFPVGRWLDSNYDAIWDFSTNNIRILDSNSGAVLWDFSTKTVNDFRVFMSGTNPGISFSCPEAGRTYRFTIAPSTAVITMTIDRPELAQYTVQMRRQ